MVLYNTDGFILEIKSKYIYKDMCDSKSYFDLSTYDKKFKYYEDTNKMAMRKLKDENPDSIITELVALKDKTFVYKTNVLNAKQKDVSRYT